MLFKRKKEIENNDINLMPFEAMAMFDFNLNYIGLSVYSDQTVVKTSEQIMSNHLKPSINRLYSEEWLLNYKAQNGYIGYNASISSFFEDEAIITFSNSEFFEDDKDVIKLPAPTKINASLDSCIKNRRSVRKFKNSFMSMADLSAILKNAYGITGETKIKEDMYKTIKLRATPSAGGLYPLSLYFYAHNIKGIEDGIYCYLAYGHCIKLIKKIKESIRKYAEFSFINAEDANLVIFYIYNLAKNSRKYGNQATTYAMIECGEIAQNVQLTATGLAYGACDIGGYEKEEVEKLLGIDGRIKHMIHMTILGNGESDEV